MFNSNYSSVSTSESKLTGSEQDQPVILVIDQDREYLDAFRFLIESENCHAITAVSADEAMEKIKGRSIDLVITEFMLGSKSSLELFTLIRKQSPEVPIAVITRHTELISELDVRMFGGNHMLPKPLDAGKLRTIIRSHCYPLGVLA